LQQEVAMPERTAPVNTSGFWEFLVMILLLLGFIGLLSTTSKIPAAGGLPQSTSTSNIPETGPVIINIDNTDPKIERAIVRILGTEQTDDFDHNILSLPPCSTGQYISVWAPGYYILTFPCVASPTMRYDVQLEPLNPTDNTNYQWIGAGRISDSPPNCARCHAGSSAHLNEYPQWNRDGHSKVFADPFFWTTFLGTNINRQPSQQIQWTILADGQKIYPLLDPMKPDYGAGYRLDYPVSNGNCAFCHVPASSPGTLQEMNVADLINNYLGGDTSAVTEGVTCDICHKVTDVLVGKNQLPYDDRPGVLSMSIVRPISDQHFNYGPLAYQSILNSDSNPNSDAKRTCFPVFSESKFCAACHYAKFANTLIYGSYKEWLESPYSNPQTPNYRSCQDCHMLDETQIQNTVPSERDACSETNVKFNFSHNMMNYGTDPDNPSREIPLLVKDAADLTLEPVLEGGQIRVRVTVLNTGAGHKFPTDSPLRHLILRIEARDWRGNLLTQSGGPMIPVWAAPDQAGYAGQIFAHILKDKDTNLAPSFAYWNPVEDAWQGADTRLVPGVPAQSVYSFAAPYDRWATITARLIYRKAFKNVVDKKAWQLTDLDVEVTSVAVKCTGFGSAPENMVCNPDTP
jgi:hypothetical protein